MVQKDPFCRSGASLGGRDRVDSGHPNHQLGVASAQAMPGNQRQRTRSMYAA